MSVTRPLMISGPMKRHDADPCSASARIARCRRAFAKRVSASVIGARSCAASGQVSANRAVVLVRMRRLDRMQGSGEPAC